MVLATNLLIPNEVVNRAKCPPTMYITRHDRPFSLKPTRQQQQTYQSIHFDSHRVCDETRVVEGTDSISLHIIYNYFLSTLRTRQLSSRRQKNGVLEIPQGKPRKLLCVWGSKEPGMSYNMRTLHTQQADVPVIQEMGRG